MFFSTSVCLSVYLANMLRLTEDTDVIFLSMWANILNMTFLVQIIRYEKTVQSSNTISLGQTLFGTQPCICFHAVLYFFLKEEENRRRKQIERPQTIQKKQKCKCFEINIFVVNNVLVQNCSQKIILMNFMF